MWIICESKPVPLYLQPAYAKATAGNAPGYQRFQQK
jgi:hypothetical protein